MTNKQKEQLEAIVDRYHKAKEEEPHGGINKNGLTNSEVSFLIGCAQHLLKVEDKQKSAMERLAVRIERDSAQIAAALREAS